MPNSASRSNPYVSSTFSSSQDQKAELPVEKNDVFSFLWYSFSDEEEEGAERNFTFVEANQFLDILKSSNNSPRTLIIRNFSGPEFPDWWGDPSFTTLTTLELINLVRISDTVPQSLGFLQALTRLTIKQAPIKDFCVGSGTREAPLYPSLHQLKLIDMHEWEAWHGLDVDNDFPSLYRLELSNCEKLREVPSFKSLVEFRLHSCNSLTGLPHTPSLRTLHVFECEALRSIDFMSPNCSTYNAWLNRILSLEFLVVKYCNNLCYPHAQKSYRKLPPSFNKEELEARFVEYSKISERMKSLKRKVEINFKKLWSIFQSKC